MSSPEAAALPVLLEDLPGEVRETLDLDGLVPLDGGLRDIVDGLEDRIDAHIVVYRRGLHALPEGASRELCRTIRAADLSIEDVARLQQAERLLGGDVALVAYRRPLELR
ncbi:MAG: hypothetical protein WEA10_00190 [Actinomycetota bacterium]